MNPHIFESLTKFRNVWADPIGQALRSDADELTLVKGRERSRELTKLIGRFVLRRRADILEKLLPPKNEIFILVKLTEL